MYKDINEYKTYKLINKIIFDTIYNDYSGELHMFEIVVLKSLYNVSKYYVEKGFLSQQIKDNIFNYLDQARSIKDDLFNERVELINNIIRLVNSQTKDNSFSFYRIELSKRRNKFNYLTSVSDFEIFHEIDSVNDSICYDTEVVILDEEEISDEKFTKEILKDLICNQYFYESLNMILKECPIMFKNKTFYNRIMCVLNLNQELLMKEYNIEKIHKKIEKKMKKYSK